MLGTFYEFLPFQAVDFSVGHNQSDSTESADPQSRPVHRTKTSKPEFKPGLRCHGAAARRRRHLPTFLPAQLFLRPARGTKRVSIFIRMVVWVRGDENQLLRSFRTPQGCKIITALCLCLCIRAAPGHVCTSSLQKGSIHTILLSCVE